MVSGNLVVREAPAGSFTLHAQERLRERIGLVFGSEEQALMVAKIRRIIRHGRRFCQEGYLSTIRNGRAIVIVYWDGRSIRCVYCPENRRVITVLDNQAAPRRLGRGGALPIAQDPAAGKPPARRMRR